MKINTSRQKDGSDAAYPDLKSNNNLASGQKICYVISGKHTSSSQPTNDMAIMELDRQISLGWDYHGASGEYKLKIMYFNTSSAWAGANSTLRATWAQLQAEHTIYLELQYGTGGIDNYRVDVALGASTYNFHNAAFSYTNLGTGSNDLILANGWRGSGGGAVATAGESRDFDLSLFSGYVADAASNRYGIHNLSSLINKTKAQTPSVGVAISRVLDVKLGLVNDEASTQCYTRFRPKESTQNLATDGDFNSLAVEFSQMSGLYHSEFKLDQSDTGKELRHSGLTNIGSASFTGIPIVLPKDHKFVLTYDVTAYDSGTPEVGGVTGTTGFGVALETFVGSNLKKEFEITDAGYTSASTAKLGNLSVTEAGNWTISKAGIRRIGGGTDATDTAVWEHWTKAGTGQLQVGWKDGEDGATALRFVVNGSGNDLYITQTGIVSKAKRYRATFFAKADSTSGTPVVGVSGANIRNGTGDGITNSGTLTTEWKKYELEFWGRTDGVFVIGSLDSGNANRVISIDTLRVVEIVNDSQVKGGFFSSVQGSSTGFTTGDTTPNYPSSLLGFGDYARDIGGCLEIIPRTVSCQYQGRNSPILVKIKGGVSGDAVSTDIEDIRNKLEALERTTKGENAND